MSVNSFVIAKYGHLPKIQAERAGVGSLGAERERGEYMCLDENPDIPALLFCLDGVLLCSQVGPDLLSSHLPSSCHYRPILPHQSFILLLCVVFHSRSLSKVEGYIKNTCPAIVPL